MRLLLLSLLPLFVSAAPAPVNAPINTPIPTPAPAFTPQLPSPLTTSLRPLPEKPIQNVDNRSFLFVVPASAAGRRCIPYLGPNPSVEELGSVQVAMLGTDPELGGEMDIMNVYYQPVERVLGVFGLGKEGVEPGVRWLDSDVDGGDGGWECKEGVVGLRLMEEGRTVFVTYNGSGRFRINVV